jgi:hypothetical protein
MALVAQRIHIGHVQEARILRAMWSVARQTALSLDYCMLEYKRPTSLCVALGADRILIGCGLEVVIPEGAMRIMAVGTFDQSLVNLVVKWHIEVRFDICMALKAKGRLADLEHGRLWISLMHGVAADAADVGLGVRGAKEIRMSACVAAQAGGIYGFGVGRGEIQDLGFIAARLHVCLSWPVAALAGDTLAAMLQRQPGMGIRVKGLCFCSMTSAAGLRSDIVGRIVLNLRDEGRIFQMRVRAGLSKPARLPNAEQYTRRRQAPEFAVISDRCLSLSALRLHSQLIATQGSLTSRINRCDGDHTCSVCLSNRIGLDLRLLPSMDLTARRNLSSFTR